MTEAWRAARIVVCPTCRAERRVDPKDAADPRCGGYYCEGTRASGAHAPRMMYPAEQEET